MAVQVHPLNFDPYLYEQIYARVDLSTDPNISLFDADEAYCRALAELSRNYNYFNARCTMKV